MTGQQIRTTYCRDVALSEVGSVLARANDRHGSSWELVGALPGGYQQAIPTVLASSKGHSGSSDRAR
jgi:hypothetical protein